MASKLKLTMASKLAFCFRTTLRATAVNYLKEPSYLRSARLTDSWNYEDKEKDIRKNVQNRRGVDSRGIVDAF